MFPSAAQLVYYIAGLLGISITRGEKDDGTIAYMLLDPSLERADAISTNSRTTTTTGTRCCWICHLYMTLNRLFYYYLFMVPLYTV